MHTWFREVFSLALILVSVFILYRPKDKRDREYAMWLLGALMGYWLR